MTRGGGGGFLSSLGEQLESWWGWSERVYQSGTKKRKQKKAEEASQQVQGNVKFCNILQVKNI